MKNEMMDRPIINENVLKYLRSSQRRFEEDLDRLERWCNKNRIPIIPHETAVFLDFQLGITRPKQILEIGAAVGFSAMLMARHLPSDGKLYTIERYDYMSERAKKNFKDFGYDDRITLIEDDANNVLSKLDEKFDFIFMDSAKSKYIEFFPYCMELLNDGGILFVDDIFQGGTVLDNISDIPRRNRTIHKKLNEFLELVNNHDSIKSTILPLGDGVIMIQKLSDK